MKVGIPRAMSFYNYYPFWYGFFNALGIEIVLSDRTTKAIVSSGSALVVSETCLPVKVYAGHILNLLDKGVDKIFVPSIQSVAPKVYNCSKIRGLPDLIKNVVKRDFTLIDATLDKSEKDQGLYEFLKEAAAPFGIKDEKRIKDACQEAWQIHNNFHIMTKSGLPFKEALRQAINGKVTILNNTREYPISIALVGHGYNIYDDHVSMKVFEKLDKLDVKVFTVEQLSIEQLEEGITTLNSSRYWANEYEMTGVAGHYMKDNKIDGIITITAFGCGPDSLMIERITRSSRDYSKPILNLSLDEHTGEAGFITRIEAFVDMLFRKKRAQIVQNIEINETLNSPKKLTQEMKIANKII